LSLFYIYRNLCSGCVLAVSARNNSICTAHKQGCFCVKADAENIPAGIQQHHILISLALSLMQLHYYNSRRRGTSPRPLFSFRHHQRTAPRAAPPCGAQNARAFIVIPNHFPPLSSAQRENRSAHNDQSRSSISYFYIYIYIS